MMGWVGSAPAAAPQEGAGRIAVIYPNLTEPYRSVFRQILTGIEDAAPGRVVHFPLNDAQSSEQLGATFKAHQIAAVIALGRHGLKAAGQLANAPPVVGGAVLASPNDSPETRTLISLTPDPRLLIQRLRQLAPSVRRVFTVYSVQKNAWLVALAEQEAKRQGMELIPIETGDLREALQKFHDIVGRAHAGEDAIWLPQDSAILDDQVVLPFVLQQAWNRSLIVFSSTLAHVRRGALFALYPDNKDMGRRLADAALELIASSKGDRSVLPLREVRLALNTRTARHLGIDLDAIENDVALQFPNR